MEIDLSRFSPRTDLIDEVVLDTKTTNEYVMSSKQYQDVFINFVDILNENNQFNKKVGSYVSIEYNNLEDKYNRDTVKEVVTENLKQIMSKYELTPDDKILVVGLGNQQFMADALGPMSAKEVIVTSHIFEFDPESIKPGTKAVSLLIPGVMGQTGMETADIVKSVASHLKPSLIILIDALATRSIARVNKVIQITDTGIAPGSGIGNNRKALSYEYLNAPCIAIGVATVVGASSIVDETLSFLEKIYGPMPLNDPLYRDMSRLQIISEVLDEKGLNMIVTPKQIDEDVNNLSVVLGEAINEALHVNRSML